MNNYINFLNKLKDDNYIITNFKDFFNNYENIEKLPEKIILLRHDVHARDIDNAYKMIELEKKILGKCCSTFFVQYNYIGHTEYESNYETNNKDRYINFIKYCINNNIDVQPHIDIFQFIDKNIIEDELIKNHKWDYDFLLKNELINYDNNKKNIINNFITNFNMYLKNWEIIFNVKPQFYSVHGTGITEYNKIFSPNNFTSIIEIQNNINCISANSNLILLNKKSLYKLKYITDNLDPVNVFIQSNDEYCKYEILIHPYLWTVE